MVFMSDGYPNEQTPNEIAEYRFLKQTYPYIKVNAIQYNMGEGFILDPLKSISDRQWVANAYDPNNILLRTTVAPFTYESFIMEDILEDDFWDGTTIDKVTQILGEPTIQNTGIDNPSNVIINKTATPPTIKWDLSGLYDSGTKASLTLDVTLKDEYKDEAGIDRLFPTNEGTTVISKLEQTPNENVSTDDTPVLKVDYKVTYEANSPNSCVVSGMPNHNPQTHITFSTVELASSPTCKNANNREYDYEFKGWEIMTENVEKIGSDYFIMPEEDVTLRAIWSRPTISKAMDGVVAPTVVFQGITTLQEMTADICAIETTPEAYAREITNISTSDTSKVPTSTLIDSRDGKTYTVSKLPDGNCWMTQNLDLGDSSTTGSPLVLTSANSDVSSSFTMPAAQKGNNYGTNFKWNEGGAGNTTNTKHMYDFTNHSTYNDKATTYGNLYNWYTATAGTGLATMSTSQKASGSICPKGWQLPSLKGEKSFDTLRSASAISMNSSGSTRIQNSPFNFPFSGSYSYSSGNLSSQGEQGIFWTSVKFKQDLVANGAYYMSFNANSVYTGSSIRDGAFGSAVRCVAK